MAEIDWTDERRERLSQFFGLSQIPTARLPDVPALSNEARAACNHYGLEWFVLPSEAEMRFDEPYVQRMYPTAGQRIFGPLHHGDSVFRLLQIGHQAHQGRAIAVERTQKPGYLPGNQQFYGTIYGFEPAADPLLPYMGRAGFTTRTRFNHNYQSLSQLIRTIHEDWSAAGWLPPGYRVSLCPPVAFNVIGTVFHQEWSQTQSLELGFYRDPHGNAQIFAVGCNGPGDFSFIQYVETESEWPLLGFRLALLPDPPSLG